MKSIKFLWLMAVALMAGACSTDGDDTIDGMAYNENFNVVTDKVTGAQLITTQAQYTFSYNITQGTAIVLMNGLQTEQEGQLINLTLNDLKWTGKNGWRVITGSNIVADGHTLDNLEIAMLPRTQPYGGPVWVINFRLDNRYDITVRPQEINYYSSTLITPMAGAQGEKYLNPAIQYLVSLNPQQMTAKIMFTNAKFAPAMPALNFYVQNVPFKVTKEGFEIEQGDGDLIPLDIQGTPNNSFPITGLELDANLGTGGKMDLNVKAGKFGAFEIDATLQYIP